MAPISDGTSPLDSRPDRDRESHPLVLYNLRKRTGIYATPRPTEQGLVIKLHEYEGDESKELHVIAENAMAAFDKLPAIERFLIVRYDDFSSLPNKLVYERDAIKDGSDELASDLEKSHPLVLHRL